MNNVVTLHAGKRWRAVLEYAVPDGPITIEHYLEEIGEIQEIVERGPDWNTLVKCTITLNRHDGGEAQERMERPARRADKGNVNG